MFFCSLLPTRGGYWIYRWEMDYIAAAVHEGDTIGCSAGVSKAL
jgi:hypothetical protein